MLNSEINNQKSFEHNKELIDLIMKEAYLSNLPEDDKKYLQDTLSLQIDRRLGLIIIENLSEEGRTEYAKLLKNSPIPDPEELQLLLTKYLPDYAEKIKVGLDIFAKEAIASLSK